ncbi:hypothetical protein CEXT_187951 [Caerostris extrusa]|uniref:Uncharacterized protein n=1 Tax=Caerostris extrusa TaxID=172846 RepID=A0AAV4MLG7_CAEEX|nr:hypothetical protein CEXT_187951 [Caerostris extrusa]
MCLSCLTSAQPSSCQRQFDVPQDRRHRTSGTFLLRGRKLHSETQVHLKENHWYNKLDTELQPESAGCGEGNAVKNFCTIARNPR